MSSLLRGTRLLLSHSLRRITYVASARVVAQPFAKNKAWTSPVYTRNFSTDPAVEADTQHTPKPVGQLSEVERRLELLDSNVRWRGRIDREEVEGVLKVFNNEGHMSEQQALMLLRCAGSLMVKESPTQRMVVFDKIWKTLQDNGFELKTAHYNVSLRVQLENKHKFSATDILSEMEASETRKPNRVTFQLLLARYCEDGDVEGATKILQYMKTENLAINETVFNNLIKGHLKKGDEEGAKGVMESMRMSGLEPSSETYKTILCCNAANGDMAAMQRTLEDAQKEESQLTSRQILEAVLVLAESGHKNLIEQLMTNVRTDASHDTLNCAHQLIACGHEEAAVQVYLNLVPKDGYPEAAQSGAKALVRTMVINDRPFESLKSAVELLKSSRRLDEEGSTLLSFYGNNYGKPHIAIGGFKFMKAEGIPVRPHFFWPVFLKFCKGKNFEDMYNAVSVMVDVAEHNDDYIPTLYTKVFRPLEQRGQDPTTIVTKLQECGLKTEDINTVQLLHLLQNGHLEEAQQFIESSPFTSHQEELKFALNKAATNSKDRTAICQVVKSLQAAFLGMAARVNGDLLNGLLTNKDVTSEEQLQLAETWIQQDLPLTRQGMERVQKTLEKAGAEESLLKRFATVIVASRRSQPLERSEAVSMSMEQLEMELKARKPSDRDLYTIQKQLLLKYCSKGNVEKADALRTSLEEEGFVFNADILKQLAYLAAHFKGNLPEALKYKQLLETNHPEFTGYTRVVLATGTLQAKEGDFEGAMTSLLTYSETAGQHWQENNFGESYEMGTAVERLVDEFKKSATPAQTRDVVQILFDHGFIKKGTFRLLEDVVRAYIGSDDMDGLIEVLEKYHDEYNRVPLFQQVFRILINKEDAGRLQKVVDFVTTMNGEMAVLHQLVLAFIDCGQVKKARKILETPGMRANMAVLKAGVDNYVQTGKEEELRHLIDITQNLFGVDKDELLFGLLRIKASNKKENDVSECLDVLAMYEEGGVKPKPRTLRYLAKVLESNGHSVPFEVPAVVNRTNTSPVKGKTELEVEAVKSGEIQTLCDVLKKRSEMNPVSTEFIRETSSQVLTSMGPGPFKNLVYFLADEADIDSLQDILDNVEMGLPLQRFTKQHIFRSQLISGQGEDIMQEMEAQPLAATDYISPPIFAVLVENSPDLLPRVEAVVERQLAETPDRIYAANSLFDHWVRMGRTEEAEAMWKGNEAFRNKSKLMNIATEFTKQNNEEGLRWLLSLAKDVSPAKQSLIFSQLVALKNAAEDVEGALSVCQEAREAGLEYTKLWGTALKQLEVQLLAKGQQPPWEVGLFDQPQSRSSKSTPPSIEPLQST